MSFDDETALFAFFIVDADLQPLCRQCLQDEVRPFHHTDTFIEALFNAQFLMDAFQPVCIDVMQQGPIPHRIALQDRKCR